MNPIDLNPEEKKRIREMLIKKVRNGFLIFIGVAILVLLILIVTGDGGKLFKGSVLGNDAPPAFIIPVFGPTVASTTPTDNAQNIASAAGNALVFFDEADLIGVAEKDITIKKDAADTDKATAPYAFDPAAKKLTIPYTELEKDTTYTVIVPADTVKNATESMEEDLTWTFKTEVAGGPPPPQACTENALQNNNKEICKGAVWVLCDAAKEGQKSTDNTKECKSGIWQVIVAPPPPPPPPPATCEEKKTKNSDNEICKGQEWVKCTAGKEGDESTDKKRVCKDAKWSLVDASPPASGGAIKIESHKIEPKGFNPLLNEAKISYEISADAKIEIKILDASGVTVVTLIDDKVIDKGDYYVWWNGSDQADSEGKVVAPGKYTYKILAKDPESGETKDIKTGSVTALYQVVGGDFEDPGTGNGGGTGNGEGTVNGSGQVGNSSGENTGSQNQNIQATVALQNSEDGVTANTGMPIQIYVLLPLIAYLILNTSIIKKND